MYEDSADVLNSLEADSDDDEEPDNEEEEDSEFDDERLIRRPEVRLILFAEAEDIGRKYCLAFYSSAAITLEMALDSASAPSSLTADIKDKPKNEVLQSMLEIDSPRQAIMI